MEEAEKKIKEMKSRKQKKNGTENFKMKADDYEWKDLQIFLVMKGSI